MWFQNRRTKNRRTVDEGRSVQVEPGHTMSESSDDSCGDIASQDTSCTATITSTTTTRMSSEATRLARDVDNKRRADAMTSRDDDDDDDDDVFIGNHGNRAAAAAGVSGWTDLCRSQTLRHGLSPMSTCPAAVTIGQS